MDAIAKGATFSAIPGIYDGFRTSRDSEIFEQAILHYEIAKNSVSDEEKETAKYILSLPKEEQRLASLILFDAKENSNVAWTKLVSHVNSSKTKLEYIKGVLDVLKKFIKDGEVEVKKFGEVMTPLWLVLKMLNELPKETWKDPNAKWLDPCNGAGTFCFIVISKLMFGLREEFPDEEERYRHIVENMIYSCELQSRNVCLWLCGVDPKGQYRTNSFWGSFLSEEFDMHAREVWGIEAGAAGFDYILGNPPYQDESKSQVKLWPIFINKGISMLKPGGSLLMVFPSVWINRPGGQKFRRTTQAFSRLQLVKAVTEGKSKWFDIGESVCYIWLKNSPKDKASIFTDGEATIEVDYQAERVVFDESEKAKNDIISKVDAKREQVGKYEWHEDLHHNHQKKTMIADGRLNKEPREGDSVIWYTASQKFFTASANVKRGWRVIVNLSGYYFKESDQDKYMKVTDREGCTSGMRSILCESEEHAKNLKTVLSSRLYRFYNDFQKTSGFNTFVFNFPKLASKHWTDAQIYEEFGLTKEEIEIVEEYTKQDK